MAEHGVTISALASKLGMSSKSLASKISGKSEFRMGEAIKVAQLLGLTGDDMRMIYPGWP